MKKLRVRSLPLKEVIADIAEQMNVPFKKNCGIYKVDIEESLGVGAIIAADFDDGLGLIEYNCQFYQDIIFEFSFDQVHPVKFLFCRQGRVEHQFLNETLWHDIPQYKNAIVASSEHHGHAVRFNANTLITLSSLELERRKFQGKISCEPTTISQAWRNMLNDVTAKKTFYHDGFYSLNLADQFREWDKFADNDFLRKLHWEGLAYNILVFQITQFQDDIRSEGNKNILREVEVLQLKNAMQLIESKLESLPTIYEIGKSVGLNSNKIQQGFKLVYGMTVNEYVTEKRMSTAKTLILNSDDTLWTISLKVGYQSQSYLSKIFKKRFGMSPSALRKAVRHSKQKGEQ